MAHDVFISYASKDKPAADALCATLEANSIRCWIAPRDITYGADWGEAIVDAISGSRAMVLVFSSSANGSPHIKREVDRAVSKGITIIPIRIEDVAPARALEYYISPVHWLDALTPPMERHFAALAEKIRALLGQEVGEPLRAASAPPPPPLAPPAPAPGRRSLLPLLAGASAVAVAALLWIQPWRPGPPASAPAQDARHTQAMVEEAARKAVEAARLAQLGEEQKRQEEAQRLAAQRRHDEARRAEDDRRVDEARRAADEARRRATLLEEQIRQLKPPPGVVPGPVPAVDRASRDLFAIKTQVEQKLRTRNLLKQGGAGALGVSVDVAPTGAVTLTGIVQSRDQRAETIRLASEVPGVSEVRPNINVRESWTR